MPAKSAAQQKLMAIAEHNPSAVKKENRGVLKMNHSQLHDFAATKGLHSGSGYRHKHGTGGNGGSPTKFRKREGGLGEY